jgi:hypothetical protein
MENKIEGKQMGKKNREIRRIYQLRNPLPQTVYGGRKYEDKRNQTTPPMGTPKPIQFDRIINEGWGLSPNQNYGD